MGIHQSDEASCNFSLWHGSVNDSLYRQYFGGGRHSSSGEESPRSIEATVDRSGIYHQHSKIYHHSNPKNQLLGFEVDSTSLQLSLPGEKLNYMSMEVSQYLQLGLSVFKYSVICVTE